MAYKAVIYVTFSGTGYEKVIVTGFDGTWSKGTTTYGYHEIPPTGITKYKVGNTYVYSGAYSFSFSLDITGLSSGDSVTMQLYVYVYTDPQYYMTYSSFGSAAVQLAETTLTLAYG